jgi:hypothetical protein
MKVMEAFEGQESEADDGTIEGDDAEEEEEEEVVEDTPSRGDSVSPPRGISGDNDESPPTAASALLYANANDETPETVPKRGRPARKN